MRNGAVLAAGSDWPVDPLNPFNQIMVAVTQVGKQADLIGLDRNLFKIPAMQINQTNVLLTMVGGKVVWEDPETAL